MTKNLYDNFLSLFDNVLAIAEKSEWGVKDLSSPITSIEERVDLIDFYVVMYVQLTRLIGDLESELDNHNFREFLNTLQIQDLKKYLDSAISRSQSSSKILSETISELRTLNTAIKSKQRIPTF
jgi:hypothetical protein